jgi:hypothetical protein
MMETEPAMKKMRDFYRMHAKFAFGMAPEDAYEIERSLKMHERFPKARSGPGGGVDATPFTVTFFTIAALINGNRKDLGGRVWGYWHAYPEGSVDCAWRDEELKIVNCEFTGKHLFGDAIQAIFTDENLALSAREIGVSRDIEEGWIRYAAGDEERVTRFIDLGGRRQREHMNSIGAMQTQAFIRGTAIWSIAVGLRRDLGE